MILSFAWTAEALLAGRKTATRRMWCEKHVAMWQRAYDEKRLWHKAYDKLPMRGGKHLGDIMLTCRPYLQHLADMREGDLLREGGLWPTVEAFAVLFGGDLNQEVCVVEFLFMPTNLGALLHGHRRGYPPGY